MKTRHCEEATPTKQSISQQAGTWIAALPVVARNDENGVL